MLNSFSCEQEFNQPQELNEQGHILECAIRAAVNGIIDIKDKLNDWDSKVGDGDCGSTVSVFLPLFVSFQASRSFIIHVPLMHLLWHLIVVYMFCADV